MTDGTGNGHADEHNANGNYLVDIFEVDVLETHKHQNTDIDESGGGGGGRNDSGDGSDENAGKEDDAGGESSETGAAACLNAGSGLNEGGNGRGAGAGAHNSADSVGEKSFLHLGHITILIYHICAACGTDEGAYGVEHIDDAEGDDEGDDGEPAHVDDACKVELEEGGGSHIGEGRNEGCGRQRSEGIGVEEDSLACPVNDGSSKHTDENSALNAFLGKNDDNKETDEHSCNGEDHSGVARVTHAALDNGGSQCAEEVAHYIEGGGEAVAFGVNANIGAETDVHKHKADGGRNTEADAEGNSFNDFFADIENGKDDEDNTFCKNDDEGGLEGCNIAHTGDAYDVGNNNGEEAVETHTGSHCEGLVGKKCHCEHTYCGSNAGCEEYAVPQGRAAVKVGEQIGVQRDDVGHCHKGGQTGNDLGSDGGAVGLQLENFFKHILSPLFISVEYFSTPF